MKKDIHTLNHEYACFLDRILMINELILNETINQFSNKLIIA